MILIEKFWTRTLTKQYRPLTKFWNIKLTTHIVIPGKVKYFEEYCKHLNAVNSAVNSAFNTISFPEAAILLVSDGGPDFGRYFK